MPPVQGLGEDLRICIVKKEGRWGAKEWNGMKCGQQGEWT